MPSLILITEEHPRQVFQLGRATLMVGRDDDSQIQVSDESVSRNHASIIFEKREYVVHDNGSTNGTFVNGIRVSRHVLRQHDILRFGSCLFLFEEADAEAPELPASMGPSGTEVVAVLHRGSRSGKVFEVSSKSSIPALLGSPVQPVKLILSTSPRKKGGTLPPPTAR